MPRRSSAADRRARATGLVDRILFGLTSSPLWRRSRDRWSADRLRGRARRAPGDPSTFGLSFVTGSGWDVNGTFRRGCPSLRDRRHLAIALLDRGAARDRDRAVPQRARAARRAGDRSARSSSCSPPSRASSSASGGSSCWARSSRHVEPWLQRALGFLPLFNGTPQLERALHRRPGADDHGPPDHREHLRASSS